MLKEYLDIFIVACLDNVLIFIKGFYRDYVEKVKKVLTKL